MLREIQGNLFDFIDRAPGKCVIPHVCNNLGAWGAGFVLPLTKKYPYAKVDYLAWSESSNRNNFLSFSLGNTSICSVNNRVWVANMVAQDGIGPGSTGDQTRISFRPLRYDALSSCMRSVTEFCLFLDAEIHCPMFGSGLAGGNWNFIMDLIEDHWLSNSINVTTYRL